MTLDAAIALSVTGVCFAVLATTRLATHLVLLGGVAVLLVAGIIDGPQALAGLSNPGVATIALLYIVASGLRETGMMSYVVNLFGRPLSTRAAQSRLTLPVAAASAFVNNTPLVAMLMPAVRDWAKRIRVPASKLLIPLSYASVLGGMCTLIGTSTNLVVHGLLLESGRDGLGIFDVSLIGLPCAAAGLLYLIAIGPRLLPARADSIPDIDDPREFTVEMIVEPGGMLVGKSVEAAGLRNLPGCFLVEIHRRQRVIAAVGPDEILEGGDQLVFVGLVDSVVDLQRTPGLKPATEQVFKLEAPRAERWFIEAVVSHRCPSLGRTIRDARFRSRYNAVVLAVARGGERLHQKLGDVVLQAGDVLLLEALPGFIRQHRNSSDFYLVSRASDSAPPNHDRAGLALAIFGAMVVVVTTGLLSMLQAALIAAGLIFITRCTTEATARRAIDWQVLLTIAAAFGLGHGLASSGAAQLAADALALHAGLDPLITFALLCILTTLTSELITNNAAAVLMFPIAMEIAAELGVSYMPFAIGVMLAASASFATPLAYQTHLMVYGAGGYRFNDFLRIGLPMDAIMLATIITVTPRVFPF